MDLGMPLFSEKHKYKNSVCMTGGEKGGFSRFWSLIIPLDMSTSVVMAYLYHELWTA